MEKKPQNTAGDRNEDPAPQGSKWPDKTIIRYITHALVLLIIFAWALVNLDVVLRFLGKVLALFTPFLLGGAIAFFDQRSPSTVGMLLEQGVPQSSCKAGPPCVPDSKHRTCPRNSVCRGVHDDPQPAGIRQ